MLRGISLRDIVDIDLLQKIQDNFSQVTKLAAVTVDYKGEPITEYSNFTRFCNSFRGDKICRQICFRSDAHGGVESARSQKPYIYKCHTGLVDFAIPVVYEGQYLGSIMAGQVKVHDHEYQQSISYDEKILAERFKDPVIQTYYDEIETVSSQEIESAAELMHLMSNYIVEQAFNQHIQEELNIKNERLIEEMKRRVALEKNLRESEMQLLQSQVNPHFLFNVLNTINSLAMIEGAERTSEMVYSLSEMFRYTIKNKMHYLVSLEQEIAYTERYLAIQRIRFNEQFEVKIHIPEALKKIKLPFMTIQPLVSNAINHGLFDRLEGGLLVIEAQGTEDLVTVSVVDNGKGMDHKTLIEIEKGSYVSEGSAHTGTGLINTMERLRLEYGPPFGLDIQSNPGRGTRVNVRIPRRAS